MPFYFPTIKFANGQHEHSFNSFIHVSIIVVLFTYFSYKYMFVHITQFQQDLH